ncbi:MAG: hypothetical protein JRI64_02310 [Deltaproteobacteria bacterium]|nr:hypothetical protein [Deltaproteobacteria bacterium]
MEQKTTHSPPNRVTDLVVLKQGGHRVNCRTSFEILPVDFHHRDNPFQAYIFLCRYKGKVDDLEFTFRKCYARGCPHNLCPHVSQAVMIANRYLQRDYYKLQQAGIHMEKHLFRLEEMTVKFEGYQDDHGPILAIHDYINIAKEGNDVSVDITLEFVPGAEHFANYENQMIFLMVDFSVTCLKKDHHYERCLACYPMDREVEEKSEKAAIADERLKLLYEEFDTVSIRYEKRFFGQSAAASTENEA